MFFFYVNLDKIPKCHPVVGDIVKVFSSEHNGLYRAKVLRKNNDGTCKVFYIDYGNMETVPLGVIYVLADELKKVIFEIIFLIIKFIYYVVGISNDVDIVKIF